MKILDVMLQTAVLSKSNLYVGSVITNGKSHILVGRVLFDFIEIKIIGFSL